MYNYRDNYANNIESPQALYVQYSQDITFDYSSDRIPDGTEEGFIWENIYIPQEHYYNDQVVGPHVWRREKIGKNSEWGLPQPFSLNNSNIGLILGSLSYESPLLFDVNDNKVKHDPALGNHLPIGGDVGQTVVRTLNGYEWSDSNVDLSNYYTKIELQTLGQSQIHWNNITNVNIDHDTLNNLAWTSSDHIGTANTLAFFDNAGTASEVNDIFVMEMQISQKDTDIENLTNIQDFNIPEDITFVEVFITVTKAPTGANAIFDLNIGGSSILNDKIIIEVGEFSSLDATIQPTFSTTTANKGDRGDVDCDQTGITKPQNGLLTIRYRKR